jgi:hypothetical protein
MGGGERQTDGQEFDKWMNSPSPYAKHTDEFGLDC